MREKVHKLGSGANSGRSSEFGQLISSYLSQRQSAYNYTKQPAPRTWSTLGWTTAISLLGTPPVYPLSNSLRKTQITRIYLSSIKKTKRTTQHAEHEVRSLRNLVNARVVKRSGLEPNLPITDLKQSIVDGGEKHRHFVHLSGELSKLIQVGNLEQQLAQARCSVNSHSLHSAL